MQRRSSNGNVNLQQAIALLIQNQAAFLRSSITTQERLARIENETQERFARIERDLDQIKAILRELQAVVLEMPEAVRQKIGFKAK